MGRRIALFLALWIVAVTAGVAFGSNSCVDCHQRQSTIESFPPWQRNQFAHWYGSVHGRHGVTCEKCHGGNPNRSIKWLAHWGVRPSMDPRSRTHYKNVPETCAPCHRAVYEQFVNTRHYKNLHADRLAPSCTTCHGFEMDVGSVSPVQMARTCVMCHNPEQGANPAVAEEAKTAVQGIATAEAAIAQAQQAVDLAVEKGARPTEAEQQLQTARARLKQTGELWHSFWLGAFEERLLAIQKLAEQAAANARQSMPSAPRSSASPSKAE